MSLFNWFSSSSARAKKEGDLPEGAKPKSIALQKSAAESGHSEVNKKTKRHARREQLYVIVRESMNHAGILSGSYKFKVLSLDQRGDQFLVMLDVDQTFHNQSQKLADIEARMVQSADARFKIVVTAVYWRVVSTAVRAYIPPVPPRAEVTLLPLNEPTPASTRPVSANRFDPLEEEERAAFEQALKTASATPAEATEMQGKTRSGTLLIAIAIAIANSNCRLQTIEEKTNQVRGSMLPSGFCRFGLLYGFRHIKESSFVY